MFSVRGLLAARQAMTRMILEAAGYCGAYYPGREECRQTRFREQVTQMDRTTPSSEAGADEPR